MRVLHLIDSGGLYGAERMLLTLVDEQIRQGLKPMILSAGDLAISEKPLEREATRLNLPLTIWRMKPGLNLREAWHILQWIKEKQYQILHCHGYKFSILFGLLPRRLRPPMLRTLHGYLNAPLGTRLHIFERLDRILLGRTERIITVNPHLAAILPGRAQVDNKLSFIPNGISINLPKPQLLPIEVRHFIKGKTRTFIAMGRLSSEKGYSILIDAFNQARDTLSSCAIVIFGDGPLRNELSQKISRLQLENHILLAGYDSLAAVYMPHFFCLIMPSLSEGLPITILEALRARIPIIATNVGAIPNVLADVESAILIPPNNIESLAEALIIASTADRLHAASTLDDGYRKFIAMYGAQSMSDGYLAVYKELLTR